MTQNQIKYWELQETKRSNLAKERENERHNAETERISQRQADISQSTVEESVRHNVAYEAETQRHNVAYEGETMRHNIASEILGQGNIDVAKSQVGLGYAQLALGYDQLAEKTAYDEAMVEHNKQKLVQDFNIANLDRSLKRFQTQLGHEEQMYSLGIQQTKAATDYMNAITNRTNAETNAMNAETNKQNANTQATQTAASNAIKLMTLMLTNHIGILMP